MIVGQRDSITKCERNESHLLRNCAGFRVYGIQLQYGRITILQYKDLHSQFIVTDLYYLYALTSPCPIPSQPNPSMRKVVASAPGKVILFGEHSVLYGGVGITSATLIIITSLPWLVQLICGLLLQLKLC